MIDFHCHLDLYPDPQTVLKGIIERNCHVLAVTTTPLAWEGTRSLVGHAPRVTVAAGLHPELVAARHKEVERLCMLIPETDFVGEVGLDGSKHHRASLALQCEVFEAVLRACELAGGRLLTVHSRGAASLVLDQLEAHAGAGVAVLHWFSGTQRDLQRAVELGCWFSVGPAMLQGEKGRHLASAMPSDRVLTETDGPFGRRGRSPLMPWDVSDAEVDLAVLWGISVTEARGRISTNLGRLLGVLQERR